MFFSYQNLVAFKRWDRVRERGGGGGGDTPMHTMVKTDAINQIYCISLAFHVRGNLK